MKTNKSNLALLFIALTFAGIHSAVAQSTAFTYQGRLTTGTNVANGSYDMKFQLYSTNGVPFGAASNYVAAVPVSNGLFTVALDFGGGFFTGQDRQLEISVRTNGNGVFTTLSPRQPLNPTPYAIYAQGAGTANTANSATSVGANAVVKSVNTLRDDVTLAAGTNVTITPSNQTLIISSTGGTSSSNAWLLGGNPNTSVANFIGTSDNRSLELRVNNTRALRLEPNAASGPNIIGGSPINFAAPGIIGAVIGGGGAVNYFGTPLSNAVWGDFSTISGGDANTIQIGANGSVIGGGGVNQIQLGSYGSTIAGGGFNTISPAANGSTIGGGGYNFIQDNSVGALISGGGVNSILLSGVYATIGGGTVNQIQAGGTNGVIAGGAFNTISNSSYSGTISGGEANTIRSGAYVSTIGGGRQNTIFVNSYASTIGGGDNNTAESNDATVGGGSLNHARESSATVGGGFANIASGGSSVVAGGSQNQATGPAATVGGGYQNHAGGNRATVPGGHINYADGDYSFAAGRNALALQAGCFVWSDSVPGGFVSTGNNQFLVKAAGGVGINTASPQRPLQVGDADTTGSQGMIRLASHSTTSGESRYWDVGVPTTAGNPGGKYYSFIIDDPQTGSGPEFAIRWDTGNVGIGTETPTAKLQVMGETKTCVLTITGGCDLAEPFEVAEKNLPKGSVVVIDDAHPGRLKLSSQPYDTRVAGIISGGNGINTGISLQQAGINDGGDNVALSGRVYVQADASNGAIKPGDLLTTSNVPGHAMKVTNHAKAQGAILGKAMSALNEGKGMVLVLVTLQ